MKLVNRLEEFLTEIVDLNQTRINTLESRVDAVRSFLRSSEYEPTLVRFSAQGSWSHKTIIKPPTDRQEFDADLVVYLDPVDGWRPSDYIVELRRVFWNSTTYGNMVSYKSRCVNLNYAGDFHLDVVPIVIERDAYENVTYSVCNRRDNQFERTDGDGFRDWWLGQNSIVGGNRLIKVARLIKYLRDYKGRFSAKSVLLTTLIGKQVTEADRDDVANFGDLPTALKTIIGRLDSWLQDRPLLPAIENPALPGESFTRNWNQDQYANFRDRIHQYRDWIDDAYGEQDRDTSISKWHRVFGDEYAKEETRQRATKSVASVAESFDRTRDIVDAVLAAGKNILLRIPAVLPHVKAPTFRQVSINLFPVRIVARERRAAGSSPVRDFSSGDTIARDSGIEFHAIQQNGLPFPDNYDVQWQIVNTGDAAAKSGDLRGEFADSRPHGYRYESTRYRGAHWVQAFLVNRRTNTLAGKSERFFVVVT